MRTPTGKFNDVCTLAFKGKGYSLTLTHKGKGNVSSKEDQTNGIEGDNKIYPKFKEKIIEYQADHISGIFHPIMIITIFGAQTQHLKYELSRIRHQKGTKNI